MNDLPCALIFCFPRVSNIRVIHSASRFLRRCLFWQLFLLQCRPLSNSLGIPLITQVPLCDATGYLADARLFRTVARSLILLTKKVVFLLHNRSIGRQTGG